MSDCGNTRSRSESSRHGQATHDPDTISRARALARPKPLAFKVEKHADGYVRQRGIGCAKRGQKTVVELIERDTSEILRAVIAGRDALLAVATSELTGQARRNARADALGHLELAGKLIARMLNGQPSERDEASSRDLTSRNAGELGELPVGAVIYAGREKLAERHLATLRAAVERRALTLTKIAPFYFRIDPRAAPTVRKCPSCSYEKAHRDGRCVRCGTQTRAL